MNKRSVSLAAVIGLGVVFVCGSPTPSYSQCAGCGADYNREDRARGDAYQAGQNNGYQQGHHDGVNEEKLKNALIGLGNAINNFGETGAGYVKGR
jgi:hypothetical protein